MAGVIAPKAVVPARPVIVKTTAKYSTHTTTPPGLRDGDIEDGNNKKMEDIKIMAPTVDPIRAVELKVFSARERG